MRHVGLKNVEDTEYLNTVIQLLSNIIPFSYFFLHSKISKPKITPKAYLSIHMNNILQELWYGTSPYFIGWDLLKLFKLHYLKSSNDEHPVPILYFMLSKLSLELSSPSPDSTTLPQIPCEPVMKSFFWPQKDF